VSFRPAPLRAAAALAVGFIAVRVVYRVLFHGVAGTGPVLVDLPVYRLAPPLQHVEVLGPVTVDGLGSAVTSALPIAAVILAFGLLNSLVDLPRLLARASRSGPLQGVSRALAVAWATLPALVDATRAARAAQRLRADRAGIRVLGPVLEHTLERASALAAALELRGYAGRGLEGRCDEPVSLAGVHAGFGGGTTVFVDDLRCGPGELVVLGGATGSGKSTLLRLLSGLHTHVDGGTVRGRVTVVGLDRLRTPPRDTSRTVGVVIQQPRRAFAGDRVRDEVGLALELRGMASVLRDARVREVADKVGITGLLERRVSELSAGEATLVAIAAAVVDHPVLLLVDEPLADLDDAARNRIVALLDELSHGAGVCVVVAEHRTDEFAAVADRRLHLVDGALGPLDRRAPLPIEHSRPPSRADGGASRTDRRGHADAWALDARNVTVRHGDRIAVSGADVAVGAGEVLAITGANGAGKSSLLVALSRERNTALVPDASDDLFVRDTVAAECRREDRRTRRAGAISSPATATRFAELLGLDPDGPEFAARLSRHPRDLSVGERRCLAIVLQTSRAPKVLLIDEPTRGLDPTARRLVGDTLVRLADAGTGVVFATHDQEFVASVGDRRMTMRDGVLSDAAPTAPLSVTRAPVTRPLAARERDGHAWPPAHPAREGGEGGEGAPTAGGARVRWRMPALVAANIAAAAAFLWPLAASAVPTQAQAAVPYIAFALAPLAVLLVLAAVDASVRSAHTLALLAVLAAIGAAVRIASTGVGGVEALFVLLILAGRVFGARFGLLLGAASIALSALMWGGVGPWLPFQMFACGWVAAGAGLLPRRVRGVSEVVMLCAYGIVASYAFGLIMNMWFWPFAVGADTSISYVAGAAVTTNLGHFLVYSLVTSTLTWDTLRAVTTVVGLVLVGRAVLAALRRATPVIVPVPAPAADRERVASR
jgi:energy-coupling factor transport system ATP-binding protein